MGARAIHVLAGRGETCSETYSANLQRALDLTQRMILIEPISPAAIPVFHLASLSDVMDVIGQIGSNRIRVMFDWYHIIAADGLEAARKALTTHRARIGHVQTASFPARAEPDASLIAATAKAGFEAVGLEYRPTRPEAETLAARRKCAGNAPA